MIFERGRSPSAARSATRSRNHGRPGRLLRESQPEQRVHRERGVPHPGVAVVPVALAAHLLGSAAVGAATSPPVGAYVMYRVDGSSDLVEESLDHWAGFRGSRPVRIGNGAAEQLQLDIYGEALDSIYAGDHAGIEVGHPRLEGASSAS